MQNQKEQFITELEIFVNKLTQIDKQTEWQPVEPQWWLEMVRIQRDCNDVINTLKSEKGQ